MRKHRSSNPTSLNPEKVAYWYLRLNGFFQIEDFYVHPRGRGGARTDADLLAVRFPFRAERLYDDPDDVMEDDHSGLGLSRDLIDVVIAEVKTGRCALNGPWTDPKRQNVHRVLAAIGCIPIGKIDAAAKELYGQGFYEIDGNLRIRLVAIGRETSGDISSDYPNITQVTWDESLAFIFDRFWQYRRQKRQTDHWSEVGHLLKRLATQRRMSQSAFIEEAQNMMGVRNLL